MKLQEIKRDIEDFEKKLRDAQSKVLEERFRGKVKFVELSVRWKVDDEKKSLDFCE